MSVTKREKNPESPKFIFDHWAGAAADAAVFLRQVAKGYVVRKVDVDDPAVQKKLVSEGARKAGYRAESVNIKEQIAAAKLILKTTIPHDESSNMVADIAKMSFEELQHAVLTDGITPTLDTIQKFKQYLLYGADYSNVDPKDPEVKKKSRASI